MSSKKRKVISYDVFDRRTKALTDECHNFRSMMLVPAMTEFSGPFAHLSHEILTTFMRNYQSYQTYADKRQLRDALMFVLKDTFPYAGLYIIGSTSNCFGTKTCDLDLCLMVSQEEIDQKHEAPEILKLIQIAFRQMNFIERCRVIRSRYPILKFRDAISGVKCNMNLNNHVSIRNTFLLRCYAELDRRVKPLVVCLKLWAKYQDINEIVNPPVLPVLSELMPEKLDITTDVRTLSYSDALPEWESKNELAVGDLFVKFLDYYAHDYDFERTIISVRSGKALAKPENELVIDKTSSEKKFLYIEEPFDLTNVARNVYDEAAFVRILRVFNRSYEKLIETKQFASITLESF